MYWKYLGKLTKSDYYIIERKDSMLIIRRGGTFLPTPGHVRVKIVKYCDVWRLGGGGGAPKSYKK